MKKQKPFGRSHGILMPLFSLDGKYGVGTLGETAKAFVDFVSRTGADMWQMLPIGPTGYGDSPYQCFSAFAGNPYFLDPEWFLKKGWITKAQLLQFEAENTGAIDYEWLYKTRKKALHNAFSGFRRFAAVDDIRDFEDFCHKNSYWLRDYTVFSALKEHFGMRGREDFPDFKTKSLRAVRYAEENLSGNIEFYTFLEYAFYLQWHELKEYAAQKKVKLVGDIPLYVSGDSADVWAHPELFMLDESGRATLVAGVPPDMFSADGQLWGNPLYRWDEHQKNGFDWWRERINRQAEFFDILRIDHFIGICRYYAISSEAETAKEGEWRTGPGRKLTDVFLNSGKRIKFIAEDLGLVTDEVKKLIKITGFPGMRLMQFAFDGSDSPGLTHNIPKNSVVYPGTHDNQTLSGFFELCNNNVRRIARRYLNVKRNKELPMAAIRECFRSPANTVIIPLADYLGLGDEARINTPSVPYGNWSWRMEKEPANMLADEIAVLAAIYKREKKKGRVIE